MTQVWIITEDIIPIEAQKQGTQNTVCGACPLIGPACYVNVGQAPGNVWKAHQAGKYPDAKPRFFKDREVRFGAFGNPGAVPFDAIDPFLEAAPGVTGYIHNWQHDDVRWAKWCMASIENPTDKVLAKILGYRTFRAKLPEHPVLDYEVVCPASVEKEFVTDCKTCMACGGQSSKAKCDIVIDVHGLDWKVQKFQNILEDLLS